MTKKIDYTEERSDAGDEDRDDDEEPGPSGIEEPTEGIDKVSALTLATFTANTLRFFGIVSVARAPLDPIQCATM